MYRFQQVSDIVYRRSKQQQQQQQQGGDEQEEDQAQSMDMWLLTDSTLAQLMDPQLAAPVVQFMVLEVCSCTTVILSLQHMLILHMADIAALDTSFAISQQQCSRGDCGQLQLLS